SGVKPSVHHFRVFGCLAHVHVPNVHRKKLDGKSIKCVHLGVSEESKAYKLYDPIERKIIVSRDVIFEETKGWNWDKKNATKSDKPISDNEDENDVEFDNEQGETRNNEGSD
ncbi:copia-type polyprotein, partial [Trifolium medium]|nr:copia-type polyprotein [Trifolium medium]